MSGERPPLSGRLLAGLMRAAGALPWPLQRGLGAFLGEIGYWLAVPARRVALVNVGLCFPAYDARARRRLVRKNFRLMGQVAFAVARVWWASADEIRAFVHLRGGEHLQAAQAAGRPVIFLVPHFLALDVGGMRIALEGHFMSMFRRPKHALVEPLLRRRERFGSTLWPADAPLRQIVRAIRDGRAFYYLPDLDPGTADAATVPFFGVPVPTLTALSRLARLTGAVVLPALARAREDGRGFELILRPPLAPFPTGDQEADARYMNATVEAAIRDMPEQYLWTYKRFKRYRPEGRSVYE
ncbi:MAG: lysophospholipid acyltransferase family protein [Gammaproteobacteria bacterium]|nr:lysophospholipid acyltransferase family protein [Gammaproteobacteria bacterium]